MQEGGPASLRNGCRSSSWAVALCEGSRTSMESKKPRRTEETCNIALALGADKDAHFQPMLGLCLCFSWEDKGHAELSCGNRCAELKGRVSFMCRSYRQHWAIGGVQRSTPRTALLAVGEKSSNPGLGSEV